MYDDEGGRHQAFYAPVRDTVVLGELIRSHERIQVERSLKYSAVEAQRLWSRAGMTEIKQWKHGEEYGEWPPTRSYRESPALFSMLGGPISAFSSPRTPADQATPRFPDTWDQSEVGVDIVERVVVCRLWAAARASLIMCIRGAASD